MGRKRMPPTRAKGGQAPGRALGRDRGRRGRKGRWCQRRGRAQNRERPPPGGPGLARAGPGGLARRLRRRRGRAGGLRPAHDPAAREGRGRRLGVRHGSACRRRQGLRLAAVRRAAKARERALQSVPLPTLIDIETIAKETMQEVARFARTRRDETETIVASCILIHKTVKY